MAKVFFALALTTVITPVFFGMRGQMSARHAETLFAYAVLRAAVIIWLYLRKTLRIYAKPVIFWMMIVGQFVWAFVATIPHESVGGQRITMRLWIVTMFLGNVFMPLHRREQRVVLAVSMITVVYSLRGYPNELLACFLAFVAVYVAQKSQTFMLESITLDAVKTYREKFLYIPRQVLMEAARQNRSISEVFHPDTRFCICVCADWRDFSSVVGGNSATDVGKRVVDFYREVSRLLDTSFPEGNYFVDWIADELFVVVFGKSAEQDPLMCRSAVEWVRKIAEVRAEFATRYGYPSGLGIGIAAGDAMVGVFGGEGIGKATAFGETPGLARRLQSLAKSDLGRDVSGDVVAMNELFVSLLNPSEVRVRRIPVTRQVKDLSIDEFAVLDTTRARQGAGGVG